MDSVKSKDNQAQNLNEKLISSDHEKKYYYEINDYDEICDDISKIEMIVCLDYNKFKIFILILLNLMTAFIINLFLVWFPKLQLYLLYSKVKLQDARFIGVYGKGNIIFTHSFLTIFNIDKKFCVVDLEEIHLPKLPSSSVLMTYFKTNITSDKILVFEFKLFKYLYHIERNNFTSLEFLMKASLADIQTNFVKGLNSTEYEYMRKIFGICDLDVNIPSVGTLILKEITDPFYLFQV